MNIKKFLVGTAAGGLMLGSMATAVLAAPPTESPAKVPDTAQCGSGAASGAFNFQNGVYGPNSSEWGQAGGAGGGQTGLNNSAVCGQRQGDL